MMVATEPTFIGAIAPVVPAIHSAPANAAVKGETAAIPARAVPAVEVEAITVTLMHINTHGNVVYETTIGFHQSGIEWKASCIRLCRNQQRAGRESQAKCSHWGILLLTPVDA